MYFCKLFYSNLNKNYKILIIIFSSIHGDVDRLLKDLTLFIEINENII